MTRVLIAEDNPINRELLRELLELRGHDVIEAADGQQALARIEERRPELAILDIQMPVLDGYEVLHTLRQDPRFDGLKVLALTAYAMEGDRDDAMAAGFDGYLSKPIDTTALDEQLGRLLGRPPTLA